MPDLVSSNGHVIQIDDDDADLGQGFVWRAWFNPGFLKCWMAVRDETRAGRCFRVCLHREIAMRMTGRRPLKVRPVNGDFLDCRRSNLIVILAAHARRGAAPKGRRRYKTKRGTAGRPAPSALWAGGS